MARRTFDANISALLHFDFPYYGETGDGLRDEIGLFTWRRQGGAKLAGKEIPCDELTSGVPKFGYRCLYTRNESQYITGQSSNHPVFTSIVEISCWVRPISLAGGLIAQLNSSAGLPRVILRLDGQVRPQIVINAFSVEPDISLTLNTWSFIRARVDITNKTVTIIINGGTPYVYTGIDSLSSMQIGSINVGGLDGMIDEFCLSAGTEDGVPSSPRQGTLNVYDIGGFGTGELGDVTVKKRTPISSACCITGFSLKTATYSKKRTMSLGKLAAGWEVMLLNNETGKYQFTRIESMTDTEITFTDAITVGSGSVQCVSVPNFNTLTVTDEGVLIPPMWTDSYQSGGIIAFRCKGDCYVDGRIHTHAFGRARTDLRAISHPQLIDNFIVNSGGGIFIACGGTFTATSYARIGANWSGAGKGGTPVLGGGGGDGGAGYGGAGGSDTDNSGLGGKGGVGGGGGAGDGASGGDAGTSGTGGYGVDLTGETCRGGTQASTTGGNSPDATGDLDTGGGGAGGNSGSAGDAPGQASGACLILIAKKVMADENAISTGGKGGSSSANASGGSGTGFCYIATQSYA